MTGNDLLKKEISTEIILEAIFSKSADLYLEMYEKGLIDRTFGTEADIEKAYGFTLIGGESASPEEVYSVVKEKIREYQKNGIPSDLIERAKKVLISQNIKLFNSVENMGNAFIRQLINGQNPLEYKEIVESVSYDEIHSRLLEHFDTENSVLSVVVPVDKA